MRTNVHALHYLAMLRHELACLQIRGDTADTAVGSALAFIESAIREASPDDSTTW